MPRLAGQIVGGSLSMPRAPVRVAGVADHASLRRLVRRLITIDNRCLYYVILEHDMDDRSSRKGEPLLTHFYPLWR